MSTDWTAVNERRISEKTQEIMLYCSQEKKDMTSRSFELARLSFGRLLDNIVDRNRVFTGIPETVRKSMETQTDCIAICSEKQAIVLARSIVYNCIGDDLNLYPVRAEQKLQRSKVKGQSVCVIPEDEMTDADKIYIAYAFAKGESFSKETMIVVFDWFRQRGFKPIHARVYAVYYHSPKPLNIKSLPQLSMFFTEYRRAINDLLKNGYLEDLGEDNYIITDKNLFSS